MRHRGANLSVPLLLDGDCSGRWRWRDNASVHGTLQLFRNARGSEDLLEGAGFVCAHTENGGGFIARRQSGANPGLPLSASVLVAVVASSLLLRPTLLARQLSESFKRESNLPFRQMPAIGVRADDVLDTSLSSLIPVSRLLGEHRADIASA